MAVLICLSSSERAYFKGGRGGQGKYGYLLHSEGVVLQFPAVHSKLPSVKQFHQQQHEVDNRHFHLCIHSLLCLSSSAIPLQQIDVPLE